MAESEPALSLLVMVLEPKSFIFKTYDGPENPKFLTTSMAGVRDPRGNKAQVH